MVRDSGLFLRPDQMGGKPKDFDSGVSESLWLSRGAVDTSAATENELHHRNARE